MIVAFEDLPRYRHAGAVHLSTDDRRRGGTYLEERELTDFIYVAQVIRHRRPLRSWPLVHYHELLRRVHARFSLPLVVDTAGSDETAVPDFCTQLGAVDILAKSAIVERTRLFIGTDGGLTHIAGALGVPTIAIHLGFPADSSRALGENVTVVTQRQPFDDPALTSSDQVFRAVEAVLVAA